MSKIKLYTLDREFLEDIHNNCDTKYPKKPTRPYVGTLIKDNEFTYFQPLATIKPKHRRMQDSIDFKKLHLPNGELVGIFNINNIIPINDLSVTTPVKFSKLPENTPEEKKYKETMIKQYNAFTNEQDKHLTGINKFIDSYNANRLPQKVLDRTVDLKGTKIYLEEKKKLKESLSDKPKFSIDKLKESQSKINSNDNEQKPKVEKKKTIL